MIKIPINEFNFSFSKSSGAGGQNINKVNTKCTLRWNMLKSTSCPEDVKIRFTQKYQNFLTQDSEVLITSQKYRSQKENINDCIKKLHQLLNKVEQAPQLRKKTKPKRGAILKRLDSKRKEGEKKRIRKKISFNKN